MTIKNKPLRVLSVWKRPIAIVSILLQGCFASMAQRDVDAHNHLLASDSLEALNQMEEAIDQIYMAVEIFDSLQLHHEKLEALSKISALNNVMGKFDQVREVAHEILQYGDELSGKDHHYAIGLGNTVMGASLARQSQLESALEHLLKGSAAFKNLTDTTFYEQIAYNNNAVGIVYYFMYAYDSAIAYYNLAMERNKVLYGPEHPNIASHYNNLGIVYNEMGAYSRALEFNDKAVAIKSKALGSEHYSLANSYENQGISYMNLGRYEEGIIAHSAALRIREKVFGVDHFETAGSHNYLGIIYTQIGAFSEAKNHLDRAIKKIRSAFDVHHPFYVQVHENMGSMYFGMKDYDKALDYFNIIAESYDSIVYAPGMSRILHKMGNVYVGTSSYRAALRSYQRALCFNSLNYRDTSFYATPATGSIERNNHTLGLLVDKAQALEKLYALTGNSNLLEVSFKTGQLADSLITMITPSISRLEDKLRFRSNSFQVYSGLMRTNYKLGLTDVAFKSSLFNYSERNKSQVLAQSLAESKALLFSNIPETLVSSIEFVETRIAYYTSQLTSLKTAVGSKDSLKIAENEAKLFKLNRNKDSLRQIVEESYPKYHQLKYDFKIPSIAEVQDQLLKTDETLIEYSVGDSAIYAVIIEKSDYRVEKLDLQDSIADKVVSLPKYLKGEDLKLYAANARELYDQLIAPLALETEKLIIIPDGILWYLNFDLLLTEPSGSGQFADQSYLIKKHNVRYLYSATLAIQDLESNDESSDDYRCLAFSYGSPSDTVIGNYVTMRALGTTGNQSLPGSSREISAIAGLMDGDYHYGRQANERTFKEKAGQYPVLHLALHGEIDDSNPMNSRLIFSQSQDSLEDDYLYAFELYNTELNAQLAILSACNTGAGKIERGEGIMSLGRAFSYAGCRSIVISQWALSDDVTPQLMKSFYTNLTNGQEKSAALRNAKLEFLKTSNNLTANPYHWAALVPIGHDGPIVNQNNMIWKILGLVITVLLFTLIVRKKV